MNRTWIRYTQVDWPFQRGNSWAEIAGALRRLEEECGDVGLDGLVRRRGYERFDHIVRQHFEGPAASSRR
jgi:hypothetical protein